MRTALSAIAIPFCAFALPTGIAQAQDTGVVYAGGAAGGGAVNGYVGGVVSLPGARLGNGLAVRAGVTGGDYNYEANGERIDAQYIGAEVALVYQTSADWGWANFSAGPRITDTSLKPNDPGNPLRGTTYDLAIQTDGSVGSSFRATWFASLGVDKRAYITQLRLSPLVDGATDTRIGIEGGIQGDRTYTRKSLGLFASRRLGDKWQGSISGGVTDQRGIGAQGYGTLGVSRVF
jgi:hypothetical protein